MGSPTIPNTFVANTLAKGSEVNANFDAVKNFIGDECIQRDGSVAFIAVPTGPSQNPTADNHYTRKRYVDGDVVILDMTDVNLANAPTGASVGSNWSQLRSRGYLTTAASVTINTTGLYFIKFVAGFESAAGGTKRGFKMVANGSTNLVSDYRTNLVSASGFFARLQAERYMNLTAGDVITAEYMQDSGGALACTANMYLERLN